MLELISVSLTFMYLIDNQSKVPVYEQLIKQTEEFVLKDILAPNDKIPSVRNLSSTLAINPNTIQKAYSELDRRGIIYSSPGRGCFICENAKSIIAENKVDQLKDLKILLQDLNLAGISKDRIVQCVEEIYG